MKASIADRSFSHDGEPKPEPPRDPNLRSWSAHLIGGSKMQMLGFVEAVHEAGAIEAAIAVRPQRRTPQTVGNQPATLIFRVGGANRLPLVGGHAVDCLAVPP